MVYRATGFSWKTFFTLTLNFKEDLLSLKSWALIENNSGKTYKNAKLKLVAGNLNLLPDAQPRRDYYDQGISFSGAMASSPPPPPPVFTESSLSNNHVYTLNRLVTIGETKKYVEFIPAMHDIRVEKYNTFTLSAEGFNQNV